MNELVQRIIDLLEDARRKHNILPEDLEANGKCFYCNGNDGTDFV